MKRLCRPLLRLVACAAVLAAMVGSSIAENYPARPVRIVVAFPPGASPDITARLMAQWLSERLGQPFVIDNRPGAGSNIGTEVALHAEPDGYTLLWATAANTSSAAVFGNLGFNFVRDSAPVAAVIQVPNVMEVNPSVPAQTVPEFVAYAKANPGKINMGSGGTGTTPHLAGELFKMMTGINMLHVPYRASPQATTDLIGGRMQVMFDVMPQAIGHLKAGELRALAVTTATRSPALPDVPTVSESVPGYEVSSWHGLVAPAKTPAEVVAKLNREVNAILAAPQTMTALANLGGTAIPMTPEKFGSFIAEDLDKWRRVVKFAGIKLD